MTYRSPFIAAMLFSCSLAALVCAEPSVLIDSLSGKAEVQRAGHITWEPCRQGDALANNDMLRVLASSSARLKWEDNNIVYVRANSQININIFQDQQKELISRHITVFYGALYFVLKKTLPKALTEWADVKVYTPTTVIGIRGTSFTVEVDKKTGTTEVAVLSGTVLVRNIIRNAALFVASSSKTTVEMNADPLGPRPIEDADIANLKTWVPAKSVDAALAEAGQGRGNPKEQTPSKNVQGIVVLRFGNSSSYNGQWKIGSVLSQEVAARIKKADPSIAISAKDSLVENPIDFGIRNSLKYVVTGDVLDFDVSQRAAVAASAEAYAEKSIALVRMRIQVIDVPARKVLYEDTFGSRFVDSDTKTNSWKILASVPFSLSDTVFAATSLGKATDGAVIRVENGIIGYLKGN